MSAAGAAIPSGLTPGAIPVGGGQAGELEPGIAFDRLCPVQPAAGAAGSCIGDPNTSVSGWMGILIPAITPSRAKHGSESPYAASGAETPAFIQAITGPSACTPTTEVTPGDEMPASAPAPIAEIAAGSVRGHRAKGGDRPASAVHAGATTAPEMVAAIAPLVALPPEFRFAPSEVHPVVATGFAQASGLIPPSMDGQTNRAAPFESGAPDAVSMQTRQSASGQATPATSTEESRSASDAPPEPARLASPLPPPELAPAPSALAPAVVRPVPTATMGPFPLAHEPAPVSRTPDRAPVVAASNVPWDSDGVSGSVATPPAATAGFAGQAVSNVSFQPSATVGGVAPEVKPERAAKFSLPACGPSVASTTDSGATAKTFLPRSRKQVTAAIGASGIDVAKHVAAMSSAVPARRSPSPAPELASAVAQLLPSIAISGRVAAEPAPAEPPVTTTVHQAVEAAWRAIELFPGAHHPGLKLQFSVGGNDLVVRLDWRREEVRAIFQTDSPELRAALAEQWQATIPLAADRSIRLADPQFCGLPDARGGATQDGGSAPRDHHRSADEHFEPAEEPVGAIRRGHSPAAPVRDPRAVSSASPRLRTLA